MLNPNLRHDLKLRGCGAAERPQRKRQAPTRLADEPPRRQLGQTESKRPRTASKSAPPQGNDKYGSDGGEHCLLLDNGGGGGAHCLVLREVGRARVELG